MHKVAVSSLLIGSSIFLTACNSRVNINTPVASPAPVATPISSPSPFASVTPSGSPTDVLLDATTGQLTKAVDLDEQNDSKQSGTVTLTQTTDGKVKVSISLSGGNFTKPQPAHIHVGSCPIPGKVQYPLKDVVNGKSETMLNVSMDQLLKSADKLAINVHKSAVEQSIYTACGNLK